MREPGAVGFGQQSAPQDVAAVAERVLGKEQSPAEGMRAVGENRQIEFLDLTGFGFQLYAILTELAGVDHRTAGPVAVVGHARAQCFPERAPVKGLQIERHVPGYVSMGFGVVALADERHAGVRAVRKIRIDDVVAHQCAEHRAGGSDATASSLQCPRRPLEHGDAVSGTLEQDSGGTAGQRAADDADVETLSHACLRAAAGNASGMTKNGTRCARMQITPLFSFPGGENDVLAADGACACRERTISCRPAAASGGISCRGR